MPIICFLRSWHHSNCNKIIATIINLHRQWSRQNLRNQTVAWWTITRVQISPIHNIDIYVGLLVQGLDDINSPSDNAEPTSGDKTMSIILVYSYQLKPIHSETDDSKFPCPAWIPTHQKVRRMQTN